VPQSVDSTRIRLFAIFFSMASWVFVIWFVGLLITNSSIGRGPHARVRALSGLAIIVALLAIALLLGVPVRCPICGERLLFSNSAPLAAASPNWPALKEQFWPSRVIGAGRCKCRNCGREVRLA
jgi:hypothetical protein